MKLKFQALLSFRSVFNAFSTVTQWVTFQLFLSLQEKARVWRQEDLELQRQYAGFQLLQLTNVISQANILRSLGVSSSCPKNVSLSTGVSFGGREKLYLKITQGKVHKNINNGYFWAAEWELYFLSCFQILLFPIEIYVSHAYNLNFLVTTLKNKNR